MYGPGREVFGTFLETLLLEEHFLWEHSSRYVLWSVPLGGQTHYERCQKRWFLPHIDR